MLRASHAEHEERDWRAVIIGRNRPLKTGAIDGTLIRVPDTPANRAMFGSVGTGDDSSPFPQLRGLPLTDASTRALLGMPHGPAGTDKAAAEQKLLDTAMREYPHLFTTDRIWIMDRNYPGAARIARLIGPHARPDPAEKHIPLKSHPYPRGWSHSRENPVPACGAVAGWACPGLGAVPAARCGLRDDGAGCP